MSFYCENCEERGKWADAEIDRLRRELAEAREWNNAVHKAITDWFTCLPELLDEPLRDKVFRELWERKP